MPSATAPSWRSSSWSRSPLATGTEASPPSRCPDLPDRRAAARAWLALAQGDLELVLERALGAGCVAVVVDRGALRVDPCMQALDDRVPKGRERLGLERADRGGRGGLRA